MVFDTTKEAVNRQKQKQIVSLSPGQVKTNTINLVFAASLVSMQHEDWVVLNQYDMSPNGATCLPTVVSVS